MYAVFSGNKPFTYQWQHSTDYTGSTFTNIPGATNVTYIIQAAGPADVNYYQLVVNNSVGGTTTTPNYVFPAAGTWIAKAYFGLGECYEKTQQTQKAKDAFQFVAKQSYVPELAASAQERLKQLDRL